MGGNESKLKEKELENNIKLEEEKYGVIASIDFGTKYTGYVYMFTKQDLGSEVYKPQQLEMKKEHTCVMLQKDSTGNFKLVSFGNEAMDEFIKLERQENDDFYFFRLFKTDIVAKNKTLFVKDYKKREVDAHIVFSKVYECVQSKTLEHLKKSVNDAGRIQADDILWVIAIPATWGHQYRDFIRKAAEESYPNRLIVLESEAASMYIRNKPVSFKQEKIEPFNDGQCYMLVDMGAGTSDICTHKVLPDGNLIEICSSTGINEGGERINNDFFNKLNELFTKEVMDTFRLDAIRLYKLENEFEDLKHKFKFDTDKDFVLLLDETLLTLFTKTTHRKFDIPSKYSDELELKNGDRVYMKPKFMASLFDPTISTITSKIQEQICVVKHVGSKICCIILSGGLSESDYVFKCISETFSKKTSEKIPVILSPNARNAVVEGALQIGLNPKVIVGRCSPYTYGFYSVVPFVEGKHPERLKGTHDDIPQCKGVFHKLIDKWQIVRQGESFDRKSTTSYKTETSKHDKRFMSLWRSFKQSPEYCILEEQCEQVAQIEIPTPKNGWPDHLNHVQRLIVLGHEFKLEFTNEDTKEKYDVVVDYVL